MTLSGSILKAYNNLPAIPPEQPLGDLLNTIPVGNPALENPPGGIATLYVSASGSDDTGDGSQANPYATPQMAIDSIPATAAAGTQFVIQCGAGTFEFPDVSSLPEQIYVNIVGDRSNPVVSLPAGAATFTKVPGQQAVWTANVGAYSPNITEGDFWFFSDLAVLPPFFGAGAAVSASSSPNLNIVAGSDYGTLPFAVYPFSTTFRNTQLGIHTAKDVCGNSAGFSSVYPNVRLLGIRLQSVASTQQAYSGFYLGGCSIDAVSTVFSQCYLEGLYLPTSDNLSTIDSFHYFCFFRRFSRFVGHSIIIGGIYTRMDTDLDTELRLSSGINFEGTGACFFLANSASLYAAGLSAFVQNTKSNFIFSVSSAVLNPILFLSSTVTGSVTGNAVNLVNGSQAIGIKSACNGTLTAGGSEIIVGGNAGQTFASLPATDFAAASPQLCRAT